jgi:hypothetical protein
MNEWRVHDVFQGTVMEITMNTFYLFVITSDTLQDWYEPSF